MSGAPYGKPEWPWVVYATAKRAPAHPIARFPLPWQAHEFVKHLSAEPNGWWDRFIDWAIGFAGYEVRREGRL